LQCRETIDEDVILEISMLRGRWLRLRRGLTGGRKPGRACSTFGLCGR